MNLQEMMKLSEYHKQELRSRHAEILFLLESAQMRNSDSKPLTAQEVKEIDSRIKEAQSFEASSYPLERLSGFNTAEAGGAKTECPYPSGSLRELSWYKGWCQGKNIMPFTEVPLREMFALDWEIRKFNREFRLDKLVSAISQRVFQETGPLEDNEWGKLDIRVRRLYAVEAMKLIQKLMEEPSKG